MTEQAIDKVVPSAATILIVEDDPSIQRLIQTILQDAGYSALVCESGASALQAIDHESIDLVLLDVMLPDMDGYEVCQRLRTITGSHLPVMMLTAATQQQSVVEGLRSGADDYVTKPFFPEELLLRIQGLLRHRRDALTLGDENAVLRQMLQLVQNDLANAQQISQTESLLRRELLHNVTTHMQSLAAIVDAELRRLPPGVERESVQRLRSRVRSAALVYQVSEALQNDPIDIGNVIQMTASALKSIYRPWKRITLDVSGPSLDVPATVASPLAMIVNELVTNCFKHAFPDNRFGSIQIAYGLNDSTFVLSIQDNGVGFAVHPMPTSGGRATVAQLVGGINGRIEWQSSGDGTTVRVRVPLES